MALKKKLTKEDYDNLSDVLKAEYMTDGEGYKLDLSDDEDTGPLKRALEREKANSATSKKRLAEVEAELEKLNESDARKRGDIATLEKQWEKKIGETKTEYETRINALTGHIKKSLVDNVASGLAHKISKSPVLLLPHIKNRLVADFEGDEPVTRILGADGKPSNMTLDDLEKEFVANKDFSAIIVGSKASGGAGGGEQRRKTGGASDSDKKLDLSKAKPSELLEHLKSKKESNEE